MFHHSQPSDNARLPKLLDSLSPNTHNLIQHLPYCCWLTNARGQQAFHPMPDTRYDPTWKTTYTDTETPDGNATLLIRQPSVFLKSLHWELMLNVVQLSKYATSLLCPRLLPVGNTEEASGFSLHVLCYCHSQRVPYMTPHDCCWSLPLVPNTCRLSLRATT